VLVGHHAYTSNCEARCLRSALTSLHYGGRYTPPNVPVTAIATTFDMIASFTNFKDYAPTHPPHLNNHRMSRVGWLARTAR
jgi:hypothetical protein